MAEREKELVSLDRFVELMNGELRRDPGYRDGMQFVKLEGGYNFVAPMLTIAGNHALDKRIFDRVSMKYAISR